MPSDEERQETVPTALQNYEETDIVASSSDEENYNTAKRQNIHSSNKSNETFPRVALAKINYGVAPTIVALTPEDSSYQNASRPVLRKSSGQ